MIPDELLLQVLKPGRYIGKEWNVPKKDFARAEVKFGLCFPDLYEVGMSNLGVRIIYGIINALPDASCERVFAVAADMEKVLREKNIPLSSLETKRPLSDFDLLGFSLGYELEYANVLNMLDLGGVPLEAVQRDHRHPLVIGGGPSVFNPEPMHAFFDMFVIGEAEEVILELLGCYRTCKDGYRQGKLSKQELLTEFSRIEGVYVPSLYDVTYKVDGTIDAFIPKFRGIPARVKKRFVADLDKACYPLDWLIPYIQIIHDRITVEIMRGCPNQCRFCQARSQYFPLRLRSVETIASLGRELYRLTGYEELSLGGLSVSNYPGIEGLLTQLVGFFKDKGVSVSLPSIRPQIIVGSLSSLLATIKKTGLTFAPEAGSERLRKVLNKDFDEQDFFASLKEAYAAGYQHVKLYFMIGLPTEDTADLDAIIDFAVRVSELKRSVQSVRCRPGAAQVNISINALIPKPHTPFQWLKMEDAASIRQKQEYLNKAARKYRRLKLHFHDPLMSITEGVLSRGDRRLSEVIAAVFRQGSRLDSWENFFTFSRWEEAFKASGIDYRIYLEQRAKDEILPWDFLDVGIGKEDLQQEAPSA